MKMKCPYKFPEKSREAMIHFISLIDGYHGDGGYPLAWDVSLFGLNFEFDHLWEIGKEHYHHVPPDVAEEYRAFAQAIWQESKDTQHEQLEEMAIEDARRGVTDDDTNKSLWDGTHDGTIEFVFAGRGGKHLCLEFYDALNYNGMSNEDLCNELKGWDFKQLREFYKFCRTWTQDFQRSKVVAEVEYHAAFHLFSNLVEPKWEAHCDALKEKASLTEAYDLCLGFMRTYSVPGQTPISHLQQLAHAAGVDYDHVTQV